MARTGVAARPDLDDRADTVFSWVQDHTREIAIGGAVIVALAVGGWFYSYNRASREERATQSLLQASQSLGGPSPNTALAESDLEKLATRFKGTNAAGQGTLLLAELLYQKGQFQQGIDKLKPLAESSDSDVAAVAEAQMAAGYEELNKPADAAARYQAAAEKARFSADRANYLASAARALTLAGNRAEATKIWTQLADDPASPVSGEARVRLGELQTQPAKSAP
jgi:predicted negative regulator of RcsB-dependent stress response